MYAMVILSLGATWPRPPSTCLGTMVNAATPAAAEARNSRRSMSSLGAMVIFSLRKRSTGCVEVRFDLPRRGPVPRVSSAHGVGRWCIINSSQTWITPGPVDTPAACQPSDVEIRGRGRDCLDSELTPPGRVGTDDEAT